ncbi:unnamed protein product [Timema podura]|uniref:Uncharacterized protein n=1 Tax=Timema podura TaxID=61482 RepID=A0ABN7NHI8_TIMPD|nr:unnamed protein product [Timema podura]
MDYDLRVCPQVPDSVGTWTKRQAHLVCMARGIFRHEKFLVEVVLLSMASRVITKICELTATILHSLNHSKPHVSFTLAKLTFSIADLLGGVRHLNYLGLSRQNVKDVRNLIQFIDNHYFNFGVYDRIPESNIYQRNKHACDHMINCTRDLVAHLEDGRYLEGLMKNLSRFLSITDPYMLEKLMERIYYVEPVEWSLDTKELTQKDWKNWTGWVKKLSYTMVRTDSALLEKFLEIIYYIPQALVKQSTLYPFSRSEMKSLYKCLNSVAVKIMLLLQNTVRAPLSLHFLREF